MLRGAQKVLRRSWKCLEMFESAQRCLGMIRGVLGCPTEGVQTRGGGYLPQVWVPTVKRTAVAVRAETEER